jgi:hypothetical protein
MMLTLADSNFKEIPPKSALLCLFSDVLDTFIDIAETFQRLSELYCSLIKIPRFIFSLKV